MNNRFIKTISSLAVGVTFIFTASVISTSPASSEEMVSSIVRGALLYDKWFKVIGAPKPTGNHKAWPAANTKKQGNATWRCKSCHGWDQRGKDGAYAKGSYNTGITGVRAYENKGLDKIVAIMKDDTHGFGGMMDDKDFADLALFVSKGQIDMPKYINADKSVKGDPVKGEEYYATLCLNCHGVDGNLPKELPKPLGKIAKGNPWETLHKILNGQPGEQMPALRALPLQVSLDVLAYSITLPQEWTNK